MKKKFLSIFLALAMVCVTAFPAMAAEYDSEEQNISGLETLSENVGGSYDGPGAESYRETEDVQDDFTKEEITVQEDVSQEYGIVEDEPGQDVSENTVNSEDTDEPKDAVNPEDIIDSQDFVDPEDIADPQDAEEVNDSEEDEDGIALLAVNAEDEENGAGEDDESDGFHQGPNSSDWYYYKDGEIDTSLTDIIQGTVNGQSGWWYVISGKVQLSYTGVTNHSNSAGWWYVKNGKVDFSANTVASNNYGTWYVEGGKVQFSYTGFGKNDSGWWYIESGKVSFSTNNVIQDTNKKIDGTDGWWYVVGGQVQDSYTGVVNYTNAYGWWYVKNGRVDFSYTGFGKNKNGWWYVESGKVIFAKNSVIQDTHKSIDGTDGWWYVVGGQVQDSYTGVVNYTNDYGWWYVKNGKVDFSANTVAENKNGWWYVEGGKVQFSYTGFGKNNNGWWYIEDGKVKFSTNSVIQDTHKSIDGTDGWWYVVGGQVQTSYTGVANYANSAGWWYINNGKVDFSYAGVAKNNYGWWYVSEGKVTFDDPLALAAQFVGAHTSSSDSENEKLSSAFSYMRSHYSHVRFYNTSPTPSDFPTYVADYFNTLTGNCYSYAASVTCIAKVLGYEARTVVGQIDSGNGLTAHGWCEVNVDGTWYIIDVGFNVYMKTMEQYPHTLVADARYTLDVENGKAVWQ